ncbi:GGDEF domain-containing protein [Umezawaea sp. Da 62-37]|uniref:GGDEF domain-containing protein n=1 Tax=Umezawaea sp. Da 62-37 TaxID=3075927 RepID=UPI0028F6D3D4|nr:GGDEF domain-containing protein [Umezawaea sp. Da 62-37]WNV90641.1 GGDEF domain-containing protein [Umezawaea sp. Da 62-37]
MGVAQAERVLKSKWRTASLAAGWPFPRDWPLREVDDVVTAMLDTADPGDALVRLGRARAEAGAGLGETLLDLAALHAVLDGQCGVVAPNVDALPSRMLRLTATGWADVLTEEAADRGADDPLTGLATRGYLRTRLSELYRESARPDDGYALVLVGLDLTRATGWSRVVAMTLVSDVLRTVFDGGETLASLGPSVAAVLTRRDAALARRISAVRVLAADRLAVDPHVRPAGPAEVWSEHLPATHEEACGLLAALGR